MFDNYFDAVRSYLFYRGADREQASDLAQDVFLKVWEKQMDINLKTAPGLLYKMAHDMFISSYRREMLGIKFRTALDNDTADLSPEDNMQYKELLDRYTKALASLSEKNRTVFMMAKMDGLKYREIADRLTLSVKAVEKRMTAALTYLKNALQE